MVNDFIEWLDRELNERSWGYNELARRAGLSGGAVSHVMNRRNNPGYDFCIKVAQALDELPEQVLRRAGLFPPLPPEVAEEKEAVRILRSMSAQQRAYVLTTMRAIAGHGSSAQRIDPYREVLNIILDMTPDELKERIIIRLQETVEEHEQEMDKHKAQGKAEELTGTDDY